MRCALRPSIPNRRWLANALPPSKTLRASVGMPHLKDRGIPESCTAAWEPPFIPLFGYSTTLTFNLSYHLAEPTTRNHRAGSLGYVGIEVASHSSAFSLVLSGGSGQLLRSHRSCPHYSMQEGRMSCLQPRIGTGPSLLIGFSASTQGYQHRDG